MDKQIYEDFRNPSNEWRGKPFWAWNGKLDKAELIRQIHVMKEMGFGGFFMHSRTGLQTEYMGGEWFQLVNDCSDEAQKLGLEAWLYDEDRWPSGTAGGLVTQTPEFRMRYMRLNIVEPKDFRWTDDILAAFAADIDGLSYTKAIPYVWNGDNKVGLFNKPHKIVVFSLEEMKKESFYNGYTYLDTLNKAAVEQFIRLTHEKYRAACGDRLGTSIKGIFIDEPHSGANMTGFGIQNHDAGYLLPYNEELFERYERTYRESLLECLPELFLKRNNNPVSPVKWRYVELQQQLFLENFATPIADWCREHGLALTGHILRECTLAGQTGHVGSSMRFYEVMDVPGIDVLGEHYNRYWSAKQVVSAARQTGKKLTLTELYAGCGWQIPFYGYKAVGDWEALYGINLRCPHLSWYTMEGQAKRDYPASILHQSAWFAQYRYVEDYFARFGYMMARGEACCDVLVIHPVESLWCQIHPDWVNVFETRSPEAIAIERHFSDMFRLLSGNQIEFDYGDEEMMSRLCRIEHDHLGQPLMYMGKAAYKVVVVTGMTTIRGSTMDILEAYREVGGAVIFVDEAPQYADALPGKGPEDLAAISYQCATQQLPRLIEGLAPPPVRISDAPGKQAIYSHVRKEGDLLIAAFLNTDRKNKTGPLEIRFDYDGFIQQWELRSGLRYRMDAKGEQGLSVETSFAEGEEKLFVLSKHEEKELPLHENEPGEEAGLVLNGEYEYLLHEPNVCVLDMARYQIGEADWEDASEVLQIERRLCREYGFEVRGEQMIQPWYREKHLPPQQDRKVPVALAFEFELEHLPQEPVYLAVEKADQLDIKCNGMPIGVRQDGPFWVDACYRLLSVPIKALVRGRNTLEVQLIYSQGSALEAFYLLGQFGVRLNGSRPTITALPPAITPQDLCAQGFPFYGGAITYRSMIRADVRPGQRVWLKSHGFGAACMTVTNTSGREEVLAYPPYMQEITGLLEDGGQADVTVFLSRRNTFGPLHRARNLGENHGPGAFAPEGDHFIQEYHLIPSGLLQPLLLIAT